MSDKPTEPSIPQPQFIYAQPPMGPMAADDEIDLHELWNVIWRGKWIIIVCTILFAVGAVVYAIKQPNIYQSHVLLAPAHQEGGGLSGMAKQFGGLASLAGINLSGGGGTDKSALAIEVLKSRQFITDFITKHDLLVPLMAVEKWDADADILIVNPELYDVNTKKWIRKVKPPVQSEPTLWQAHKVFSALLSVVQMKDTGMVVVSVEHLSPSIAKQWVDLLIQDLNAVMKRKEVNEAQQSIEFLKDQLNKTSVTEMQNVFFQLIEEQTKTIMLSEVREEYIFTTIDPAVVPEERAKPKRALIAVLGTILGGMLGVMVVLIRHFSRNGSADAESAASTAP